MYSQNDEEKYIVEFFKDRVGSFLDIGAYDGITFSNTRRLWELGWSGVLVEPNPDSFSRLQANYTDDRVILVNAGINSSPGLTPFFSSKDAVSTSVDSHKTLWEKAVAFQKIYVNMTTVGDILDAFPGKYPFVNIDVEGDNLQVLKDTPLDEIGCQCLCVEYGSEENEIIEHVTKSSDLWKMVYRNAENLVFVR
jgi:FkbM family methyltransferase